MRIDPRLDPQPILAAIVQRTQRRVAGCDYRAHNHRYYELCGMLELSRRIPELRPLINPLEDHIEQLRPVINGRADLIPADATLTVPPRG